MFLDGKCHLIPPRVCVPQMSETLLVASLPHTLKGCWCSSPRASDRRPRLRGKRGWVASCLSGSRASLEQLSLPHGPVLAPGRGVGLTGIAGQRAALISGSRTQVHPRYTQDQSLGPPASTRELVPFCLLSAGTSESLGSPHTISSPSCAW